MSLREVRDRRLFDDATTDERRARFYVRSGELGVAPRADLELMRHLRDREVPQRVQVVGPSGAGKTSLIMRVLADLAEQQLQPSHEVLVLRVGDDPEHLANPTQVMKLVLGTIEAQKFRFSNVDPHVLHEAGADGVTVNPPHVTHEVGLDVQVASYSAQVEETFKQFSLGENPARVRQDLQDVLSIVSQAGHRPVLVLDDTEKFVTAGPERTVDRDSISNLYHHGVRALASFDVDLVIAMHPRFEEVPRVVEIAERFTIERIEVPELPPESEPVALAEILTRRLVRGGVEAELAEVIEPAAVAHLQLLYHDRESDLRSVLKVAHGAAEHALGRDVALIEARDVRRIVAESPR